MTKYIVQSKKVVSLKHLVTVITKIIDLKFLFETYFLIIENKL